MSDWWAHSSNLSGDPHGLLEHLQSVGQGTEAFLREKVPWIGDLAYMAGLLHDLGKYTEAFQRRVRQSRDDPSHEEGRVQHAVYGAWLIARTTGRDLLPYRSMYAALANAIAGHHAGLYDWRDKADYLGSLSRSKAFKEEGLTGIEDVLANAKADGLTAFRALDGTFPFDSSSRVDMATRMVFSALVDADFLDTERHFDRNKAHRRRSHKLPATKWLETLSDFVEQKVNQNLYVKRVRSQVYAACVKSGMKPPGAYSLTVPTGGGKTLASLAFALSHATQQSVSRIIVCAPYISIVSQTAGQFREALGLTGEDSRLLEHHSALTETGESGEHPQWRKLAAENWDAPLVVTTLVQLLNCLYKRRPTALRKLHRISGSVLVIDEIQSMPAHLIRPTLDSLKALVKDWGVTVVACTATQPALSQGRPLDEGFEELIEINPHVEDHFRSMRRVTYRLERTWSIRESMPAAISREDQALAVVNTRAHARFLSRETGSIHLSTSMCQAHRMDVLQRIHRLLESDVECRVVSTQLIEAGVDLDFPKVFRVLGPLERIVQAAGRCNREGKSDEGEVIIVGLGSHEAADDRLAGHEMPPALYREAANLAMALIDRWEKQGMTLDEALSNPACIKEYFENLYGGARHRLGESILEMRKERRFKTMDEEVTIIEDGAASVLVPWGEGAELIQTLLHSSRWDSRAILRKLRNYSVSISQPELEVLSDSGRLLTVDVEDEQLDGIWRVDRESYDDVLGLAAEPGPTIF